MKVAILAGLSFWSPLIWLLCTGHRFGAALFSVAWAVSLLALHAAATPPPRSGR